jgi:hypothetical protein
MTAYQTYNLYFLPGSLVFLGCFMPGITLQEHSEDTPHLVRVGASRIHDGTDTGYHSSIEHSESSRYQMVVWDDTLNILSAVLSQLCQAACQYTNLNLKSILAASKQAVLDCA